MIPTIWGLVLGKRISKKIFQFPSEKSVFVGNRYHF